MSFKQAINHTTLKSRPLSETEVAETSLDVVKWNYFSIR